MIRSIRSNHPTFRNVDFTSEFNVILAERTKASTKKDSRNGLGKTTLIEIIHFCLGSRIQKGKGLFSEPLKGWSFSMDFDFFGKTHTVTRSTEQPTVVFLEGDDFSNWPLPPSTDKKTGNRWLRVRDWNTVLGNLMFNLPLILSEEKYTPSFRCLISYFGRRGKDAFSTPFEFYRKQKEWDKQICNAYLLNLRWENAQRWQILKDQKKSLAQLKNASKTGVISNFVGTIGQLEPLKVRLEDALKKNEDQIHSFRVHPQYKDIEQKVNGLTESIHKASNDNIMNRKMIEMYESNIHEEKDADKEAISSIYDSAGVELPELVKRRLDQVQEFHHTIVANRKNFLAEEIKHLTQKVNENEKLIEKLSDERASLLNVLKTHGALEEYSKLQEFQTKIRTELENVKNQIQNLKKFEQGRSAINIDLERLNIQARSDFEERKSINAKAISIFNQNSEALYNRPGKLIIDIEPTGFKFQVDIERSSSQGVEQMKIFCYDLMLAELWAQHTPNPGFLVHDSTIFDGVDERQIANALMLVKTKCEQFKFQYICCMNSDLVPWKEFDTGFDLKKYISLELTDAKEGGNLLGIQF